MRKEDAAAENLSMSKINENYFQILGLKSQFIIDQNQLQQNYLKLQQIFHPDKQINKSNSEKIIATEFSAKLNHIYQILKDDKKRAEYLLSLDNIIINSDDSNIKPDTAMLAEILEFNEEKDLIAIKKQQQNCWDEFKLNYPKDLQKAAQAMIKLQYLNKI